MNEYKGLKKKSLTTKQLILRRDEFKCVYCGVELRKRDATLDHIIPHSQGGTRSLYNLVTSCWDCNLAKGSKSLKGKELIRITKYLKEKNEELKDSRYNYHSRELEKLRGNV